MRFKRIEFNNYRCFLNGTLDFEESDDKNICLVIGPNGGGKTEMLFAFWWTLYEFDFSKLQGKENTPYSLNTDLYKELERSSVGEEKECSVILEFENSGIRYRMKKTEVFRRTEKSIRHEAFQEFSSYNNKGEWSLPLRDQREIDKKLNKIIPRAILYGIIFDGERMQKLSSADEKSKKAIQGVINDITNVELIENCISIYRDIRKELNSSIKKLASQTKQNSLEEIIQRISEIDTKIDDDTIDLDAKKDRLEQVKNRLDSISEELKNIEGARKLEIAREEEKKKIDEKNKRLDEYYKNFSASLKDAYLLDSKELLDAVDNIIQRIDVPVGLTVESVKSILSRPNCICGNCIGEHELKVLNELILSLPPDNINSTLAEVIRQTKDKINDVKSHCKDNYKYIVNCEKEIKDSKETIASLSAQILSFDEVAAQELENENRDLLKEQGKLENSIEELDKRIVQNKDDRDDLIIKRDTIGKNNENTDYLNKQLSFVEKCLSAFEEIKARNKERALTIINSRLEEAYSKLSEDSALGNDIYIVQYDESRKYQMIVYIKKNVVDLIGQWKRLGTYANLLADGISENQIKEKAILECADSNSTGQSKMNTLSFVKAILDYSNEQKEEDGLEIQKEYPFLIDAPFSDISGDNLKNASQELHNFSGQIVLMLDAEKYENVKAHMAKYVSKTYKLSKNNERNETNIILEG